MNQKQMATIGLLLVLGILFLVTPPRCSKEVPVSVGKQDSKVIIGDSTYKTPTMNLGGEKK